MSEVKRFYFVPTGEKDVFGHPTFICHDKSLNGDDWFVAVEGHDRVAELKAEVIKLNSKLGFLIGVLEDIMVYENDADMRREFARKALEKLEKQGEGT